MKKFAICLGIVALISAAVYAATVTNDLGGTTTVSLMSEITTTPHVDKDQSVYATPTDRRGLYVAHYEVPAAGITGAVDIALVNLPKGSILLENGVIEVQTAVLPAAGTASLAVGGITVLSDGNTLEATGIDAAVATPGITTAADKLAITVSGTVATQGVFTVYLPYVMGNAQ